MALELHRERNAHETFPTGRAAGPVPREALAYFDERGLTPRVGFDYRDVWAEEHAIAFTVARVTRHDVLAALREEMHTAIADGVPVEAFIKSIEPRLARLGWWGEQETIDPVTGERTRYSVTPRRLRNMFDTNMRQSRAAGQWDRIQRVKESRPYLMYLLGPSREHRHEHVAWAGTILPVDHPFWLTHMPQNGWGCKCHVRQLTQREVDRLGGVTEAPDTRAEPYTNARTGDIRYVPVGIDPGFEFNPGIARTLEAVRAPMQMRSVAWQPEAQEDYRRIVAAPMSAEATAFDQRWRQKWQSDSTDSRAGLGPSMLGSSRPYRADMVGAVYQSPVEHLRTMLQPGELLVHAIEAAAHRYARTQQALAEANISTIEVWRGIHPPQDREVREAIAAGAQRIRLAVRPLVSTALDFSDARDFAEWGGGFVLRMDVAAVRVFSHPLSDARLAAESEVILLNPEGWIDVDIADVIKVALK